MQAVVVGLRLFGNVVQHLLCGAEGFLGGGGAAIWEAVQQGFLDFGDGTAVVNRAANVAFELGGAF